MIVEVDTPNGNRARYACRPGTNDAQLVHAVVTGDEYRLAGRHLDGWAIDVGAHIGSVAVALAIDFDVSVIAVEPVPENRELIAETALLNEVNVTVDGRAADSPDVETVDVPYGYRDDPGYWYVGGMHRGDKDPAETATVAAVSLTRLLDDYGIDEVAFLKIDCEGCEFLFLADPAVARVREIAGEVHGDGGEFHRIEGLLGSTHAVEVDRGRYLFQAVRK